MFNRSVAAFAALLLTLMMWHLHMSRLGFMVISWPFIEVAVLFALFLGYRRQRAWLFILAGVLAGLGVYTYNSYLLFLPVLAAATLWMAARAALTRPLRRAPIIAMAITVALVGLPALVSPVRDAVAPIVLNLGVILLAALIAAVLGLGVWLRPRPWSPWTMLSAIAALWLAAFVVAAPMLRYIDNNTDFYRAHQKSVGLVYKDQWKQADGLGEKAEILWERAKEWERGLINGGRPDLGDGLATSRAAADGRHPVVDPIVFVLVVIGLGVAAWNWKRAEYALLLFAVLIIPWAALLTVGDGLFRRTIGLAPIVAVLAAFPLAWLWERIWRRRDDAAVYAYACLVLLVPVFVGARTTYQFFGPVQDTPEIAYIFPYQLDAASHYMDDLPEDTHILFWSNRWSFNYETRRFLAPDATGEDRSIEFRLPPAGVEREEFKSEPIDYGADTSRNVAFIFLGTYLQHASEVERRYPGGEVTEIKRGNEVLFHAYYLPAD
jgi:hypothetical protein